ncbi:hypothetical protein TKK_0014697 [Trichogramma kaykai]
MSEDARKEASRYCKIITRGKKNNKKCAILLDDETVECIKMILQYRDTAGTHPNNPYIFALPNKGSEFNWIDPNPLVTQFAQKCGAKIPSLLRDMEEDDTSLDDGGESLLMQNEPVDYLDNMDTTQQASTSSTSTLESNLVQTPSSTSTSELNLVQTPLSTRTSESYRIQTPLTRKTPKSSSAIPAKCDASARKKWTSEINQIIADRFLSRFVSKEKIPGQEIQEVITANEGLRGRTVEQVRSHLQWLSKSKPCTPVVKAIGKPRNKTPTSIYQHFSEYIKNKNVPPIEIVCTVYQKSPALSKYTPTEITDWIRKAIKFNDSFG